MEADADVDRAVARSKPDGYRTAKAVAAGGQEKTCPGKSAARRGWVVKKRPDVPDEPETLIAQLLFERGAQLDRWRNVSIWFAPPKAKHKAKDSP